MKKFLRALLQETGSFSSILFLLMIISGLYMTVFYDASPDRAFDSFQSIKNDFPFGFFFRSLHKAGTTLLFMLSYWYLGRGLYSASYRSGRIIPWFLNLTLFLLMMGIGFTGYVLPWGQMSYWSATVILNLVDAVPVIGTPLVDFLWRKDDVPNLFWILLLHILLSGVFGLLVFWGKKTRQLKPLTQAQKRATKIGKRRRLWALTVLSGLFLILIFVLPGVLDHPENAFLADPLTTPDHVKPEWYFLPFYAILRSVTEPFLFLSVQLCGALLMFGSAGLLFLLPLLDRSRLGPPSTARKTAFILLVFDWVFLAFLGAVPPEDFSVTAGQVATAYYFMHFLVVLPLLSFRERQEAYRQ